MHATRNDYIVGEDGKIVVANLPVGERVSVIVLPAQPKSDKSYPLRGTPCKLDNPFEPSIPDAEWNERL